MLSDEDRSLADRDSALTGLRFLLDVESLRDMLPESNAPARAQDLRVGYLRYKPGVNCIARLDLNSGFAYAKAFAGDAEVKLAKAREKSAVDGPYGIGRTCHDGLGIMVSFFPNDSKLPAMAKFGDPANRQEFLKRIFKEDPAWSEARYTSLNYKPERRFVARLSRPDGRAASIKFYSRKEFDSTRRARKKFSPPQGLEMPQWIGGSKNHRVMAYSWLPGDTLQARMASGQFEDCALAGEALARLHRSTQPALGTRGNKQLAVLLASLSAQLGHLLPDLADQSEELRIRLSDWVQQRKAVGRPIHGDFYDKQVIMHNGTVGIIDSDRLRLGDPELDLGCFVAHLERRRIDGVLSADQLETARRAMLDGYREAAPAQLRPRDIDAYTALNLFQLSHHPFRDRRANWGQQTADLLKRCSRLLNDHS